MVATPLIAAVGAVGASVVTRLLALDTTSPTATMLHAVSSVSQENGPSTQVVTGVIAVGIQLGMPSEDGSAVTMSPIKARPLPRIWNGILEYVAGAGVAAATDTGTTAITSRARATPIQIIFFT